MVRGELQSDVIVAWWRVADDVKLSDARASTTQGGALAEDSADAFGHALLPVVTTPMAPNER